MNSPVPTENEIGGVKIPKPIPNTFQQSSNMVSSAVRTQTANRGHNVFRPDVYRVSEGYLN